MLNKIVLNLPHFMQKRMKKSYAEAYYAHLMANLHRYPHAPKSANLKNILTINTIAGYGGAARAAYEMLTLQFNKNKIYHNTMLVSQDAVKNDDTIKEIPVKKNSAR